MFRVAVVSIQEKTQNPKFLQKIIVKPLKTIISSYTTRSKTKAFTHLEINLPMTTFINATPLFKQKNGRMLYKIKVCTFINTQH